MSLTQDAISIIMKKNFWEPYIEIEEQNILFAINRIQKPKINPIAEKRVEDIWAQKVNESKERGRTLTSDPLFGVLSVEQEGNKCILNVYESEYKYVVASRNFQIPGYCEYFLGVRGICFFESNEVKYIILGERKKEITYMGGDIEPIPAGLIEPEDLKDDPVRTALMRELREEIPPTDEDDVVRITPITLKRNRQYVSFDIRCLVELNSRWLRKYKICQKTDCIEIQSAKNDFPEHERIIGVSTTHLSTFILANGGRLTHSKDAFLDIQQVVNLS
ncbi:MAG: hypothetical protein AYK18_16740 [Theionarchaea archaeon DG-70]|nr:MAG: hypothetical protein AYK18_16740 [Theionarchaea archaeon DG-70]